MHKFKLNLKEQMSSDYKAKFANVFQQERKKLLEEYKDNLELTERIVSECLKDKRNFRPMAERARAKIYPKIPVNHEEIDLEKINLKNLELMRTSHSDPNIKNKDIILLGTPITAEAWAKSEFKSGDGTFKGAFIYYVNNLGRRVLAKCLCLLTWGVLMKRLLIMLTWGGVSKNLIHFALKAGYI